MIFCYVCDMVLSLLESSFDDFQRPEYKATEKIRQPEMLVIELSKYKVRYDTELVSCTLPNPCRIYHHYQFVAHGTERT